MARVIASITTSVDGDIAGWYGGQDSGYGLAFTLRGSLSSPLFTGYAQSYVSQFEHIVGGQYLKGGIGTTGKGIVGVHMDVVWTNGRSGQYNATAYDARPTSSGGLTAALHGTVVDTTGDGHGGAARWWADGLEGPLGDNAFTRPLWCAPRDVVRWPTAARP